MCCKPFAMLVFFSMTRRSEWRWPALARSGSPSRNSYFFFSTPIRIGFSGSTCDRSAQRCHHIDEVPLLIAQLAHRRNSLRPMGNQGRRDASFLDPVLVFTERRIRNVGPVPAIGDVGIFWSRQHLAAV